MLVYLGIYSALALTAVGNYRRRNFLYFLVVGLFLVWFMGFRYETGCDYLAYLHRWTYYFPLANISETLQEDEAGFLLLMGLVQVSGLDFEWLNVTASVILVLCYIRFASGHPYSPLILALLFPVIIIQLGMSGIRQALAGAFLMLAFNAFSKKQKLMTALLILIGMQFHTSVVIFLPFAFLAGREVNTMKLAASMAILGPIAAVLVADRFETYESRYIENTVTSGGAVIRYALILLPVPVAIAYRDKLKKYFPDVYPLLKMGILTILALAPLVVLSSLALHRLNFYVMPLSILLMTYTGAILFKKQIHGHYLAAFIYGAYSLFWFLISKHATLCYVPYQNTWL